MVVHGRGAPLKGILITMGGLITVLTGCIPQQAPDRVKVFTSLEEALAADIPVESVELRNQSLTDVPGDLGSLTVVTKLLLPALKQGEGRDRWKSFAPTNCGSTLMFPVPPGNGVVQEY